MTNIFKTNVRMSYVIGPTVLCQFYDRDKWTIIFVIYQIYKLKLQPNEKN